MQIIFTDGDKEEIINVEAKVKDFNDFVKQLKGSSFTHAKTKSGLRVVAEIQKLSYDRKDNGGKINRNNKILFRLKNLDNGKERFIDLACSYFDYRPVL